MSAATAGWSATRRLGFPVAYLLFMLVLGVLALEAGVRVAHLAPALPTQYQNAVPDEVLPFKPRPYSRVAGHGEEFDFEFVHNSMGFRDVEHDLVKPAGTFRILGIGDSFTYGVGAPFAETFLARLEGMLNARGTVPVEIVKAGIYKYFAEPERLLLEHYGFRFHPDLILVAFVPNDVVDTYLGVDAIRVAPGGWVESKEAAALGPTATWLYVHSHLARIVLRAWVARARPAPQIHWDDVYRAGGFHERDWQRLETEYDEMAALARARGVPLVVVGIPEERPADPEQRAYPERRMAAWSAARGVPFVDVLPAMRAAADRGPLYWRKDGHCTPAGYGVVAEAIYATLVGERLVP